MDKINTYRLLTYPWKCWSTFDCDEYAQNSVCYIFKACCDNNIYIITLSDTEFDCNIGFNPSYSSLEEVTYIKQVEDFNSKFYEIRSQAILNISDLKSWVEKFNKKNKENSVIKIKLTI